MTRKGTKNEAPPGVKPTSVHYDDESALVAALKGQQFLAITLGVMAPPDLHSKIVHAAAKAGVPRIFPNLFYLDETNESLLKENHLGGDYKSMLADIEAVGCSWTMMVCSLWYEYSLAMGPVWFGFDFANKKLKLYDDGKTKVNLTTWEQCGRALAAFLSLKELPKTRTTKA